MRRRATTGSAFIKRIVAGPGDSFALRNGQVIRNGQLEPEPFIQPCPGNPDCTFVQAITVPKGDYYVLGDNRADSYDSRFFGPIQRAWIIARVARP